MNMIDPFAILKCFAHSQLILVHHQSKTTTATHSSTMTSEVWYYSHLISYIHMFCCCLVNVWMVTYHSVTLGTKIISFTYQRGFFLTLVLLLELCRAASNRTLFKDHIKTWNTSQWKNQSEDVTPYDFFEQLTQNHLKAAWLIQYWLLFNTLKYEMM